MIVRRHAAGAAIALLLSASPAWAQTPLGGQVPTRTLGSSTSGAVVYRDDFFTYIRYGEKWDGMELSTAYVTIDGIDELVNSRVQGSTFIVESVAPLITLKNGKKFLCIRYDGEKS